MLKKVEVQSLCPWYQGRSFNVSFRKIAKPAANIHRDNLLKYVMLGLGLGLMTLLSQLYIENSKY